MFTVEMFLPPPTSRPQGGTRGPQATSGPQGGARGPPGGHKGAPVGHKGAPVHYKGTPVGQRPPEGTGGHTRGHKNTKTDKLLSFI